MDNNSPGCVFYQTRSLLIFCLQNWVSCLSDSSLTVISFSIHSTSTTAHSSLHLINTYDKGEHILQCHLMSSHYITSYLSVIMCTQLCVPMENQLLLNVDNKLFLVAFVSTTMTTSDPWTMNPQPLTTSYVRITYTVC